MEAVPVNASLAKGCSFHTVSLKQQIKVQQNRSEKGEGFEEYLEEKRASLSIPRKPTRKEQVANLLRLRRARDAAVAEGVWACLLLWCYLCFMLFVVSPQARLGILD
jgi:hypothetical protein